jgi:N-acetyl-anhydromuramyl-L-alanine amidase AmpD
LAGFFYGGFFEEALVVIENDKEKCLILNQENINSGEKTEKVDIDKEKIQDVKKEPAVKESDTKNLPLKEDLQQEDDIGIVKNLVNFGYDTRENRKIDTIIIHSSYDALGKDPFSVEGIISEYRQYGVSAHYLIDRSGIIYQLVEDKNVAYHAGVSIVPDGRNGVNEFSIGIELVNTKNDKYTDNQYKSLNSLLELLKNKYRVKYVLGHNQIAPERKDDPWNFKWDKIE